MTARLPSSLSREGFLKEHCSANSSNDSLLHKSKQDRLELLEARRLLRVAFYKDCHRAPPTSVAHMPGYVRAVKKHWNLQYNNSARQLLAEVEGFQNWTEMMAVLSEVD